MYVADFTKIFNCEYSKAIMYADDTVIIVIDTHIDNLCLKINETIMLSGKYCNKNMLKMNLNKTEIMLIKDKITLHNPDDNSHKETAIWYKYLGYYTDNKLKFEKLATGLCNKL